jgi:hypothetical protein
VRQKSLLPLASYTRRKFLRGTQQWAYYFEVPTWARKPKQDAPRGPCPVQSEEFGIDYAAAVMRVEKVLLPQFESWRTRGIFDPVPETSAPEGTLRWMFVVYKATDAFKTLDRKTRKLHQDGFDLVGSYLLKDGRELGSIKVSLIDTSVVDPLYEKLRYVPLLDGAGKPVIGVDGQPVTRQRLTTVNHAMKSCRRAWNIAHRRHPKIVPTANPFAKMGLKGPSRVTPTASYPDLVAIVRKLDETGAPSLGTALMVTWEWLQREEHIFTVFEMSHYRPKDRPNEVLIVHPKNGEQVWIPLFEHRGKALVQLFPELTKRLDDIKRNRIGGLMFYRDWPDAKAGAPIPWATTKGDLTYVRQWTKKAVVAAELAADLSFTSFRHGGLTELGDSELTDSEIRAISRQQSSKVLPRYIKRTEKQIIKGTKKRRATRTKEGRLSE